MTGMQRADFRFAERLRVRWAEIDAQKIVFNGHYLMYVDTAIAAYWRSLAMPYAETMESLAGDLYVKKATLEYHASARYDEQLEVGVRCERVGTSSMLFRCGVFRGPALLVSAEMVYVFANPHTQTSQPVPPVLRDTLMAHEAGEPMVAVACGPWAEQRSHAQALRQAVFVDEQGLPGAWAYDDDDGAAVHAVARNRFGGVVGTGRLQVTGKGVGMARLSRLAVLPLLRAAGIGRALVTALENHARAHGAREVELLSGAGTVGFYERLGYRAQGDPFVAEGLKHQRLVKTL
jgi:YbgC/YbaW family acyl-CoA thioester hydrolase